MWSRKCGVDRQDARDASQMGSLSRFPPLESCNGKADYFLNLQRQSEAQEVKSSGTWQVYNYLDRM